MNGSPLAERCEDTKLGSMRARSVGRLARRRAAPTAAVLLAATWAGLAPVAGAATGGQRAGAADQSASDDPTGALVLAVIAPELASSARRDFELNITRGLRFSGLDVAAESAGGAAPAVAGCADPGCLRAIGAARGAIALVRASVRPTPDGEHKGPRRSYTIEIEAFPTAIGRASIQRRSVCTSCAVDVATHLAYLLATEVGQKLAEGPSSSPALTEAPPPPPLRPEAPVKAPVVARPLTVASDAAPSAPAPSPAMLARDTSDEPTVVPRRVAASVLGGLGVAAATAGAVLWLRGPQSTCPGLPPSACGQTYDDTTTGQVLVGAGAAALAGAIVWWSWPTGEEHPKSPPSPRVAITSRGVLVGGRF